MYIARLQLRGFKSFGGSHDLPLAPGMTAIVGPNGSGKSNILDSMRWVLGDSHSSKLRVAKQGGLIFHGSASCPPADEASVAIQLREGTKVCSIRRRVLEAGTVLTVDGARVTLAELDEVKRQWQLSGDKFAFIGQGDVAEVIQQRPSARRVLLESLFGIDAYRRRREDASGRLSEAREEYGRLRTFRAELNARRGEIAPEVERALRARELLDALEEARRGLYWVRRSRNESESARIEAEKRCLAESLASREAWRAAWERSLELLERDMASLSQTRQTQIHALDEAKNALAALTRAAYGCGTSLASSRRRAEQIRSERAELAMRLESLSAEMSEFRSDGQVRERTLADAKKSLADAEERRRRHDEAARLASRERDRVNRERGEVEGELATLKGRMRAIGMALRELDERKKRGGAATLSPSDSLQAVKRELDGLERRHAELLDEQESAASLHRDVYARLQETSSDLQRSRRESSKLTNRVSELQEQVATEVYPRPVQHVVSAARLGRLKARACAAIDAFECPEELASTMEAFLGGRQFWVFVDTMDEAGLCIDLLKKNQMGRATFLPLERARPRQRDEMCRLPASGVVGWAMKLMKSDEHWRPALEHIMGDLIIVEGYGVGQLIVRGGFRGPVATLEGDVFQPAGTVSGGRSQKQGRTMEIVSALSRLEAESSSGRRAVEALTQSLALLEEEEASASARKEAVSVEIRELASARSALDAKMEEIQRERARAKSERESMRASLGEGARRYAELARRKRELDAETVADVALDLDAHLFKETERLKSIIAVEEEKSRSGLAMRERMSGEVRSLTSAVSDLDEEFASCERDIMANRGNLSNLSRRYAQAAANARAAAREMAEFGDRYEAIARRRAAKTARLESAKLAVQAASEGCAAVRVREAELSRERTELIQTWDEQYPYPGDDGRSFAGYDADELRRGIRENDRSLKAMGEVDMGVLSEDRSLRDRTAFLGDQLDDVGQGIIELERLISDADEQARGIFSNALEEIDKKFNALFQRLFIGGDARLEMIEGESLWDSGVDVVARPPGKHPASIAQLSGGEQSLSAIALLFASLEVASCPIAVLDEVDAALDEVNLRRFADLARDASKERQIFVMTHRRVTMERADVLYGVTLAEPGLSQVIGVRVEDWA
ncbi:MAG: chromosome segregation protein SMC [Synergistaceae bacterium]|nr:chromosome segregation protein SMC [Synergistaceae bacterium]